MPREASGSFTLDYLSRPEAFSRLYPKLLSGYLLDALERLDRDPAEPSEAGALLAELETSSLRRGPSPGLGSDIRLSGRMLVGSGLALDGELVQLSAYAGEECRPERDID